LQLQTVIRRKVIGEPIGVQINEEAIPPSAVDHVWALIHLIRVEFCAPVIVDLLQFVGVAGITGVRRKNNLCDFAWIKDSADPNSKHPV
jgi:hypothetical protein